MPRLIKVKMPRLSTILLFMVLTAVLAFPNTRSLRGMLFMTLGVYLFCMMILRRSGIRWMHCLWVVSFYVMTQLSIRWSIYPEGAVTVISNVSNAMLLNWCLGEYIYQGKWDFGHSCRVMLAISVLLSINFLVNNTLEYGRYSLEVNANVVGMNAAFLFGMVSYGAKEAQWKKWYYNLAAVIIALIALLTGSRKALMIILMFVAAFVFFWVPEKNMKKFMAKLLVTLGVLAALVALLMKVDVLYDTIGNRLESLYQQWFMGEETDASAISRARMISIGMNIFKKKPWIGFGHNAFKMGSGYDTYSHNNYVELLCSMGIIGTLLFYIPLIYFTVEAFRLWRKGVPGAILPLTIFVIQFVNDIGQVSYYNLCINIFLGMAAGYVYLLKREYKQGKYDDLVI